MAHWMAEKFIERCAAPVPLVWNLPGLMPEASLESWQPVELAGSHGRRRSQESPCRGIAKPLWGPQASLPQEVSQPLRPQAGFPLWLSCRPTAVQTGSNLLEDPWVERLPYPSILAWINSNQNGGVVWRLTVLFLPLSTFHKSQRLHTEWELTRESTAELEEKLLLQWLSPVHSAEED